MSELEPHDSVYGGEMTPYEWYQAEMEVDDECEAFERIKVTGYFKAKVNGEVLEFNYYNTTVFLHDDDPMFDYIVYRGNDDPEPYIFYRPYAIGEENEETYFDQLMMRCASIKCDFVELGSPRTANMERLYNHWRGDEPMEEILGKIMLWGAQQDE